MQIFRALVRPPRCVLAALSDHGFFAAIAAGQPPPCIKVAQVTNKVESAHWGLNINLLLFGRPHLTHSLKVAAYNLKSTMGTIHIEAHKNKDDLSRFVEQGITRRLQLDGAYNGLKQCIQATVEEKAKGMFLWANPMLEILKWQTMEDDIRTSLDTAPEGIDDMITEMLKVYSSMFKGREAEEFNTILAWLSRASRPLTLAEVDAALRRLSPTASRVLSLEDKLRTTYASHLDIIRDDGLSTATLHARQISDKQTAIPETTTVSFAHASIAEYFRKSLGKFSRRKTAAAVGVIQLEAEVDLLTTSLQVFVNPGDGAWLESSMALQAYAKHHWFDHLHRVHRLSLHTKTVEGSSTKSVNTSAVGFDITLMLHHFFEKQDVVRRWSCNLPWEFYDANKTAVLAEIMAGLDNNEISRYLHLSMPGWREAGQSLRHCFFRSQGYTLKEACMGNG
jgi:hypothetical protein